MRKLFWTCTMCSVMLAGAVISTAHFAVHHPQSAIGRVLNGASYAAAFINPVSGLGSVASHVRAADPAAEENDAAGLADPVPADPEAVPEDPVPVTTDDQAGVKSVESGPIVAATTGAAPIVIAEEGHTVPPYDPVPKDADVPWSTTSVEYAIPISLTEIECPAVVEATAPRAMPYCEEEQECELLPMPTEESEMLPMPAEEPEMLPMPQIDSAPECTPCTDEPTPKCDGPCHHKGCCPHSDKACPATPRGEEEPSEAAHTSVRRKLSIFHIYDCDDACPKHPDVDTMEYRSSDRHLYDYGPGSL